MLKKITHLLIPLCIFGLTLGLSLPAVALSDLQGNKKQFEDLIGQGRWTVFEIWSSECPACPDAVFYMQNLKNRYDQVDLIGISTDGNYGQAGRQMAQKFVKQHKLTYPNLLSSFAELDTFLLSGWAETLFGTPTILIFNPEGQLKGHEVGALIAQDIIDFIEREKSQQD